MNFGICLIIGLVFSLISVKLWLIAICIDFKKIEKSKKADK